MVDKKQRLELTWIGKENRPQLEPRILLEDPEKSYHAPHRVSENDILDNRLIFGDNLLALKALEQEFAGKIKCIYIDPPYNTGSAFDHYDDGIEHSLWLSLMRDRLDLLKVLLREDGVLFAQIDDNEQAHLRILLDEAFGRKNFIAQIVWQKKYAVKSDSEFFSDSHEYILVFAKDRAKAKLNRLSRTAEQDARYANPDSDPRGPWTSGPLQRNEAREYAIFPIRSATGKEHWPPQGTSWRFTKDRISELIEDNRIWFGQRGNNVPRLKRFLSEVSESVPSTTWWDYKEAGHNDEARRESKALANEGLEVFSTPKPERLIKRIVGLASNPGDIILDSFAGSGTTGAVAHKMGRRWIMVELGEHCHTHIISRMKKVIDGDDPGGITNAMDWKGGGGFRYFRLAPSLLEKDKWDNWVISGEYNATMLASAMAKHEGFIYNPDDTFYWKQGRSTEKDYIFTTTNFVTIQYLDAIHEEMATDESLLICCKSFQEACADRYANITVKKIPNMLLGRCEFGKEDYSLNIADIPPAPDNESDDLPSSSPPTRKTPRKSNKNQPGLFDTEGE